MPTSYDLTGDLGDLLAAPSIAATARAWLETNVPGDEALVDTTGQTVRLGGLAVSIGTDGSFTATGLVGSDSTDLNVEPGTLQYQLVVEYRDAGTSGNYKRTWRSGWFFLNATSDIATVAKAVTPAVAATGAEILRDVEAAAATALAPTDTQVATLAQDPTSETGQALSATVAARGESREAHFPLTMPLLEGSLNLGHPSVVYSETPWNGYRYWMAVTPYPPNTIENPCILASHDGVRWEEPAGVVNPVYPLSWAEGLGFAAQSDTHLILDGDSLVMFWRPYIGDATMTEAIYRATSADGVTWTGETEVVRVTGGAGVNIMSPAIVKEADDTYTMWSVNDGTVERRTSADSLTWSAPTTTTLPGQPIGFEAWHLDVHRIHDRYYMLLNAISGRQSLFYLESSDGLTWEGNLTRPIIPASGFQWDEDAHYRSCMVPVQGQPLAWDVWVTGVKFGTTNAHASDALWRLGLFRAVDLTVGPLSELRSKYDDLPRQFRMRDGRYYGADGPAGTTPMAADSFRSAPIWISEDVTVTAIGLEVTVAGTAGAVIRLGIYADTGDYRPGLLVLDAGTVDATSTGFKEVSGLSLPLARGTYWIGAAAQGGATTRPTVRAITGNAGNLGVTTGGTYLANGFDLSGVPGALPAGNYAEGWSPSTPRVMVKVAR